ncbi:hypothetical protein N0V90_006756 [Kalmusia sp. IMI 367209]|nr:hypothetical protein N0V90_006756 [Kalmusia sp. IMI 367209]
MDFAFSNTNPLRSRTNDDTFTNYVSYQDPQIDKPRVGHYDLTNKTVRPLRFLSGTPISNLYQVIEAGSSRIISSGEVYPVASLKILPPLTGRDVLCVGKNYAEHAKEFNSSGFDSSDKVDQPSHPVIFTKRYTSIIADGEDVLSHPEFTQTADYEGEIGVIIGQAGFRIAEKDAMNHVWGYTIINDMTARERQRDHKQFYIGKSADTFCPMGPIAVPASKLPKILRVQTHVNGELRQDATTDDLIFSIPHLIKTMSEGQTLMPGDVLATGTPAGVGIGRKPPIYLHSGDIVSISVTGLGTLTNRIASLEALNVTLERYKKNDSLFGLVNAAKSPNAKVLTTINSKPLSYKKAGKANGPPMVFVHGLGATSEYFTPLISAMNLGDKYSIHLFDIEGHGLSPSHPLSTVSLSSLASDLNGVFEHAGIASDATLIADSMGCLIALKFVESHSMKVSKLVLMTPTHPSLLDALSEDLYKSAETARAWGMMAIVDNAASITTQGNPSLLGPLALAAMRMSLLGQDSEGYAKGCMAFARAKEELEGRNPQRKEMKMRSLVIEGDQSESSLGELRGLYAHALGDDLRIACLNQISQWAVFQKLEELARVVDGFLDEE